jgi:hypothetical protein
LATAFEQYQQAVGKVRLQRLLKGCAAFSRKGPLTAWAVIWLILFQRLHPKGTLAVAARELLTGGVRAHLRWPQRNKTRRLSANTSALSQARSKLPLEVVEQVSDWIFGFLNQQPKTLPELGRPMFLLDGSSVLLSHSKELVEAYPPARNQYGVSHWPVMRVVVAHDVVSGLATRPSLGPMYGPQAVSEQGLAKSLLARLPAGSGVIGDRNFGVFSMAYHAGQHQHPCLMRLTKQRAGKLNRGFTPNAGTDKAIRWVPSRDDLRSNPEIPADAWLEGRLVVCKVPQGRRKWLKLYFFTTLDLPAKEIAEVYGYRWNVETDLRSLKREVRLYMVEVQSKAMAEKEVVLAVAAYNLTRSAMNEAATALKLDPRDFSFSLAQDTLNAFLPLFAKAQSESERQALGKEMLRVFGYSKLPRRSKRRAYPRKVWGRPNVFPRHKPSKKRGRVA